MRRRGETGTLISLSGADPLNLAGILTPGPKLPALTGNRVLYRDGVPIGLLESDAARFLPELDDTTGDQVRMALFGHPTPAAHLRDVARPKLRMRRLAGESETAAPSSREVRR